MSLFNKSKFDLSLSPYSNQGKGTNQFISVFTILLIQLIIFYPLRIFLGWDNCLVIFGLLGILGIIFNNQILKIILKQFYNKKYLMFEVSNLTKKYNNVTVLDVPNLKIEKGESFGLVGNNGAGKTTLFCLMLDIIKANNGAVLSKGRDVKIDEKWKSYTGSYLDESFLIDYLTPEEYFEFIGGLHNLNKEEVEERLKQFHDFFNGEILGTKKFIRNLSKGNQKKVGIIGALLPQPEILILDEPFPHLDPSSVIKLKKILKTLSANKVTIIISSHDLNHVTEICKRIVLLEKGKIINDIQSDKNVLTELEKYFSMSVE
jgi:ABC-2 type transport system ATP-binding protein